MLVLHLWIFENKYDSLCTLNIFTVNYILYCITYLQSLLVSTLYASKESQFHVIFKSFNVFLCWLAAPTITLSFT